MKYDLNTFGFTIGIGWKPHFMCRGQRGMKYTLTLASSITFIAVIILSRSYSWLAIWWQYSAFFFFWARKPTALNHYTVHGFLCACVLLQMWFGQFCSVKKSNILQSYILLYLFQHNFFVSLILQSPFLRDLILGLISLVLWVSEILKKKQTLCLVWRFVSCQFVACVDSVISHVNLKDKMLLSTGGLDMVRVFFFLGSTFWWERIGLLSDLLNAQMTSGQETESSAHLDKRTKPMNAQTYGLISAAPRCFTANFKNSMARCFVYTTMVWGPPTSLSKEAFL